MTLLSLLPLLALPASLGGSVPAADLPVLPPVRVEASAPATYKIDPTHSELIFRIRHLTGRVSGTFRKWGGTVTTDPANFSTGNVSVEIDAGSISTMDEKRDEHLRGPDFFDAGTHSKITFKSHRVEQKGQVIRVHGDLTIRGVTKRVVLSGVFLGRVAKDPWGAERLSFSASTKIDRQDFGVAWNQLVEGAMMLGDEVDIMITIEAVRT